MPVTQSTWANWEATPPDFVTANPWIFEIRDALADASAIAPSLLSIWQFDVARPIWQKYLSGETADAATAGQEAFDAVRRRVQEAQTGSTRRSSHGTHGSGGALRSTGPRSIGRSDHRSGSMRRHPFAAHKPETNDPRS